MPKAKKQKNGRWRCQISIGDEYVNGKRKQHVMSFTADSKAEAEDLASEYRRTHGGTRSDASMTLSDAITRYIDSKSNILSPTTITGYKSYQKTVLEPIAGIRVNRLDQKILQHWANDQAVKYSPKYMKNAYGLVTAAVRQLVPQFSATITFPAKQKKQFYIPSYDEVMQLIDGASQPYLKRVIMLAAFCSLRRGEICALTMDDIDFEGGWVTVSKDMVITDDKDYIIKQIPKTQESMRSAPVPDFVLEALKDGLADGKTPKAVSDAFEKLVKRQKMPHIRLHDLRHFFASYLHLKGIPDAYIEKYGGWKPGSRVMAEIYRNTINAEELDQAKKIKALFEKC